MNGYSECNRLLPAALDKVLERAMHPDREQRFSTIADFRAALLGVAAPKHVVGLVPEVAREEATVAVEPDVLVARARGAAAARLAARPSEGSTFERAAVSSTQNAKPAPGRSKELVRIVAVIALAGVGSAVFIVLTQSRVADPPYRADRARVEPSATGLTAGTTTAPVSPPVAAADNVPQATPTSRAMPVLDAGGVTTALPATTARDPDRPAASLPSGSEAC